MARMSASDVLLYENPYPDPNTYYPAGNPHRRRHHRRNPNLLRSAKQAFAGLDLIEMAAAIGGFAAAAMLPGYILKPAAGATLTTLQKVGKVAIGVGFAIAGKVLLNRYKTGVGNAVMYGAIAGAGAMALKEFTTVNVINRSKVGAGTNPMLVHPASQPAGVSRSNDQAFIPANAL